LPIPRVKIILEPLAIAANVMQATHTHLDHVLFTLGNLFRIYSDPDLNELEASRTAILISLEKRWSKADQDVFIFAGLVNPYNRGCCFNCEALPEAALFNVVSRVYERIVRQDADLDLVKAFTDYVRGLQEFSDENMSLSMMAKMYETDVSITI
jgi:hypothetical protein